MQNGAKQTLNYKDFAEAIPSYRCEDCDLRREQHTLLFPEWAANSRRGRCGGFQSPAGCETCRGSRHVYEARSW